MVTRDSVCLSIFYKLRSFTVYSLNDFVSRILIATNFHINTVRHTRVPTGQGKLEKVREFEWSGKVKGKVRENIFWKSQGKVRENEMLQLVKNLLSRFVKRDVIDSLVT